MEEPMPIGAGWRPQSDAEKSWEEGRERRRLGRPSPHIALPVAFALAACGGTVATGDAGPDQGAPPGSTCTPVRALPADLGCTPSTIPVGLPTTFELGQSCGSDCETRTERCDVTVTGSEVRLELVGTRCVSPEPIACPDICLSRVFACDVPALPAGRFTVRLVNGQTSSASSLDVLPDAPDPPRSCTVCLGRCAEAACSVAEETRFDRPCREGRTCCVPRVFDAGGGG
jgi:hypothetical protein